MEGEGVGAGAQDRGAENVGGHQVGRGLHALKAEAEQAAQRLDHQGLGDAWNALEQRMPLAENGDQHFFDRLRLAGDHAAQFGARVGDELAGCAKLLPARQFCSSAWQVAVSFMLCVAAGSIPRS